MKRSTPAIRSGLNKFTISLISLVASLGLIPTAGALAVPVYLNNTNITVAVGSGTSPGTFNNTFNGGATIEKTIDAPSATALEFHNQTTHIWFTADEPGGGLELLFDFGAEYDINTLHFWNYTSESFDVDNIQFTFLDAASVLVGSLSVAPSLGSPGGIAAEDIALAAPLNVRYVTTFLTGTNRQVDFQNIGFTAEVSTVPEPATYVLMLAGLGLMGFAVRRKHGA